MLATLILKLKTENYKLQTKSGTDPAFSVACPRFSKRKAKIIFKSFNAT